MALPRELQELAHRAIEQAMGELGDDATKQELEDRAMEIAEQSLTAADEDRITMRIDGRKTATPTPAPDPTGIFAILDEHDEGPIRVLDESFWDGFSPVSG